MRLGKTLFIHIPRTGGTHFERLLGFKGHGENPPCGHAKYPTNRDKIMGWDRNLGIMLQHTTYSDLLKHKLYDPEEDLATVSIIRSPYERTVSLYNYYGGSGKWRTFESFLQLLNNDFYARYFYYPQYKFLYHDGELKVDNLIRFDNYKQDAEKFSDENNLNLKVTFDSDKHERRRENLFREYYNNKSNIEAVERVYSRDFEVFNFDKV